MAGKEAEAPIGSQEGSRWINKRPSGEEVAAWFRENVTIHEGLDPADYVGGVVLIGANEKLNVAKRASGGSIQIVEENRYTWTPYAKVETRVKYFWDLMAKNPEWVGAIEPVEVAQLTDPGVYNVNLPPGFYRLPMQLKETGQFAHYVACSMRVVIYRADSVEYAPRGSWPHLDFVDKPPPTERELQVAQYLRTEVLRGLPVAMFPPATKMIPTLDRYGKEDPYALMKAETGAVGRALGMAGMLVIPGSGIATAEDMNEVVATGVGVGEQAALPPDAPLPKEADEAEVREKIQADLAAMQTENVEGYAKLEKWAAERKVDLANPKDTQLRGLTLQIKRMNW